MGIQDPGNVGTLLRSSEAAGATGLLALPGTAHPFGWKALRGSMGSALRLPIAREADGMAALQALRSRGVRLAALTPTADVMLDDADLTGPIAVCAGAEGAGVPDEILTLADIRIRIPMCAPVESLNVGVATSLVLFEIARQRRATLAGNWQRATGNRPPGTGNRTGLPGHERRSS
jgi:TrmH family RNA methyltransferase